MGILIVVYLAMAASARCIPRFSLLDVGDVILEDFESSTSTPSFSRIEVSFRFVSESLAIGTTETLSVEVTEIIDLLASRSSEWDFV